MTRPMAFFAVAVTLSITAVDAQAPRTYDLPLDPVHVHWGYYDAKLTPALHVASVIYARGFYEKLGYEPTATKERTGSEPFWMQKTFVVAL